MLSPILPDERGVEMQQNRAAEIISSSFNFEVTWHGKPVWIESVNKVHNRAGIVVLGSQDKWDVPIEELEETGNFESMLD